MTNNNENLGEFKGTTREALAALKEDVKSIQTDISRINKWLVSLTILTAIAVIERLPQLISLVSASAGLK